MLPEFLEKKLFKLLIIVFASIILFMLLLLFDLLYYLVVQIVQSRKLPRGKRLLPNL